MNRILLNLIVLTMIYRRSILKFGKIKEIVTLENKTDILCESFAALLIHKNVENQDEEKWFDKLKIIVLSIRTPWKILKIIRAMMQTVFALHAYMKINFFLHIYFVDINKLLYINLTSNQFMNKFLEKSFFPFHVRGVHSLELLRVSNIFDRIFWKWLILEKQYKSNWKIKRNVKPFPRATK